MEIVTLQPKRRVVEDFYFLAVGRNRDGRLWIGSSRPAIHWPTMPLWRRLGEKSSTHEMMMIKKIWLAFSWDHPKKAVWHFQGGNHFTRSNSPESNIHFSGGCTRKLLVDTHLSTRVLGCLTLTRSKRIKQKEPLKRADGGAHKICAFQNKCLHCIIYILKFILLIFSSTVRSKI